jgi:hypothetical protein
MCAWSTAAEASTTNASQCSLTMNFTLWVATLEADKELESLKARYHATSGLVFDVDSY